jgi:maltooligosyltrehalose trehalohydrolase
VDCSKVAIGIVLTAPSIPLLFQGEEYAASTPFQYFAHHDEPELVKAVREGRKREFAAFGWDPEEIPDPESVETLERSKLNWDEKGEGHHAAMLEWVRKLIQLRRRSVSLNDGDPGHVKVAYDEKRRWLTMDRGLVTVMCNLGNEPVEFENARRLPVVLASRDDVAAMEAKVVLPPNCLAILSGEK